MENNNSNFISLIIEICPIIIFFIIYKFYDVYYATITIIVFSFVQMILSRYLKGKVSMFSVIAFLLVLIFGGLTVLFKNDIFIKIKPTILYFAISTIFLISHFVGAKQPIIIKLLKNKVDVPKKLWSKISYSWIIFFIFIGLLNLYIAYNCVTDIWVYFKLFGIAFLFIVFIALQLTYIYICFKKE